MNELELIISLITQLGDTGKEAFLWWLFFDKFVIYGIGTFNILIVLGAIYKIIKYLNPNPR